MPWPARKTDWSGSCPLIHAEGAAGQSRPASHVKSMQIGGVEAGPQALVAGRQRVHRHTVHTIIKNEEARASGKALGGNDGALVLGMPCYRYRRAVV